tara:strand:+ start:4526 stop:4936 length:411 start_codon:yes stop_codon:yes gene_type:complete
METYVHQALLNTNSQPTQLLSTFFSDDNLQIIQKKLKNEIKKHTGLSIDNQSCDELYQVMLYVYRTFGRNVTTKINAEVAYLNDIVIREISPSVISNVLQYINYIKDISKPPSVIPHGKSTNIKGENSLAMPETYF